MDIRIGNAKGKNLEVTMKLIGDPVKVVHALVNGLPRPVLQEIKTALETEIAKDAAAKKRSAKR